MSGNPISTTAQPRPDASNPHLVALLRLALCEQGCSFQQLVKTFRWHRDPEWLAGVTKLAHEMGLIASVQPKAKKTKKTKQPSSAPDDEPLILPVPLRPQTPKPANVIKLSDRREPASWMVEGDDDE
jgi:hypothetical protein